jgi:DNA polymerase-3 subunit epsilon
MDIIVFLVIGAVVLFVILAVIGHFIQDDDSEDARRARQRQHIEDNTRFRGFDEAVVVDVETTGLNAKDDHIVAVAAIRVNFAEDSDIESLPTFNSLVNPRCPIPADATAVHGITDDDVKDSPMFSKVAWELRDFIGDHRIIAHNARFDKAFLNAAFRRCGVKGLARSKSSCTMRRYALDGQPYTTLSEAAQELGVDGRKNAHHDALEDARICARIAQKFWAADN